MAYKKAYDPLLSDFITLLETKGYNKGFKFIIPKNEQGPILGTINDILVQFLKQHHATKANFMQLETYIRYHSEQDNLRCRFRVAFDEHAGFRISEMMLRDAKSRQYRRYAIKNNKKILRATDIAALFPKEKQRRKKGPGAG